METKQESPRDIHIAAAHGPLSPVSNKETEQEVGPLSDPAPIKASLIKQRNRT